VLEEVARDMHGTFKEVVLQRRGARLKAPEQELFSGEGAGGRHRPHT
jgi:hypothetical protein